MAKKQKKFKQEEYDIFFNKILDQNLCQAIENNPKYIQKDNQIDFNVCESIQK